MVGFAAWATSRRAVQDDCIVVECSDRYDGNILTELFDDLYFIETNQIVRHVHGCVRTQSPLLGCDDPPWKSCAKVEFTGQCDSSCLNEGSLVLSGLLGTRCVFGRVFGAESWV